jgi:hypothetical protein
MADEARLNELLDLVEQARAEGDKDTEAKAVAAYKRESAPNAPFRDIYGGAGGYNPIGNSISGLVQRSNTALGMTPENLEGMGNSFAPAEVGMQMATGAASFPIAGLAGVGQGVKNLFSPGMPATDRVAQVQNAMTYQPRSGAGSGMSRVVNAPFELYGKGTNYLGEKVADTTGSPAAGAAVKTLGDLAPSLIGARSAPKRPTGPRPTGTYNPEPKFNSVPTTKQLGDAAKAAYKRAEDAGIAISSDSFDGLKARVADTLNKEGLDRDLHPNTTAALKRLTEESGPITLEKLETLRRIALDAEDTLVKSDAKKAGDIVDAIDEYVDNLSDAELTSGRAKDAAALKEARALYTRKRKGEDIDRLIKRAEFSPSGFENGLAIEFRSLAKNDRRFKRFSPEEQAAIERVAKGGLAEKGLRLLGKAAPTGIVSGGLSSGAGFAFGGPVGAVAVPALGIAGRVGAKYLTARNARQASELVRGGPTANPLATDIPMLPLELAQALVAPKAARSPAKARTAEQVRQDIARLSSRVQFELASESAGSPKVQAAIAELQALQRELAATQAGR